MKVSFKKYYDKNDNRIELLLINYEYYDGIELIVQIFTEEFGFEVVNQFDGIWFKKIQIKQNESIYELLYHEDIGNSIYSLNQTDYENMLLETRMNKVVDILNKIMNCS